MSLRRFIPQKDTTIVAAIPGCGETNYGKDEILELGKALESSTTGSARILMQFAQEDLASIASFVGEHNYRAKLHLSIANALNIPERLEIVGTPIAEYWEEGFGKAAEEGNMLGATWTYRMPGVPWFHPGNSNGTYDGEEVIQEGEIYERNGGLADTLEFSTIIDGGNASLGSEVAVDKSGYRAMYDINLDITDLVRYWTVAALENYGIMLFVRDGDYWAEEYGTHISIFSADTHTIYQPYLEIEWDDSEFNPSVPALNDRFKVVASNLQAEYTNTDEIRFNLEAKNLYPSRVFSTSSLYNPSYVLPKNSLWGIKDEYTNEMTIPFDETYTKVSAKENQSYFNLDMNMLYPERYYRILLKVPTASGDRVVDNKIIFKVIRNGRIC